VVAAAELRELNLRVPSTLLRPAIPLIASAFKATEDAKAMQIDAGDHAKTLQIGATLDPK
jgi:hypothetical protein